MEDKLILELTEIKNQFKSYIEKATAEKDKHGSILEDTVKKLTDMQKQVDAIDVKIADRMAQAEQGESIEDYLKKEDSLTRMMAIKNGHAHFSLKGKFHRSLFDRKQRAYDAQASAMGLPTGVKDITPMSNVGLGFPTPAVIQAERIPGIVLEARRALTIRDLLPSRPTTAAMIDYVKVNSIVPAVSPVAEGVLKPETTMTFTTASEKIRTLATFVRASKQVLDDFNELLGFIRTTLAYYVDLTEETQLLSGDGTGDNLHGLIPQAVAFNTGLLPLSGTYNILDVIGRAIQQIAALSELPPTFAVMNIADWWNIRITKDGFGRYLLGDPQTAVAPSIWGLDVLPTISMTAGTFLVGNGSPAAVEIRDREDTQVDLSTEDRDNFPRNLVTVRCEKRLALIVQRPNSFVTGSFTHSPA